MRTFAIFEKEAGLIYGGMNSGPHTLNSAADRGPSQNINDMAAESKRVYKHMMD